MTTNTSATAPSWFSRKDIGLRPAKRRIKMFGSQGVFIHHSAGRHTADAETGKKYVRNIQNLHMEKKHDIAYSWLVDDAGNIYEGRGWGVVGGHTPGKNREAHGFCYLGDTQKKRPTQAALEALRVLIAEHNKRYPDGKCYVQPHSNVGKTACPGKHLRDWLKNDCLEQFLVQPSVTDEEDDEEEDDEGEDEDGGACTCADEDAKTDLEVS